MSHDRENWLRVAKERDEIKAERDQLRVDRYYNRKCINRLASATGTLGEKSEKVVEVALSTIDQLRARAERAEASLHAMRLVCGTTDADKFTTWVDRANARAEKAEAELAAAKERLRSEAMDDYGSIKDLQRELATERARLDAGMILLTVAGERVWYCGVDLRSAIDAAMKEGAK
jgi:predicted  nucleic acid-binding Zn-ribbon protein